MTFSEELEALNKVAREILGAAEMELGKWPPTVMSLDAALIPCLYTQPPEKTDEP